MVNTIKIITSNTACIGECKSHCLNRYRGQSCSTVAKLKESPLVLSCQPQTPVSPINTVNRILYRTVKNNTSEEDFESDETTNTTTNPRPRDRKVSLISSSNLINCVLDRRRHS